MINKFRIFKSLIVMICFVFAISISQVEAVEPELVEGKEIASKFASSLSSLLSDKWIFEVRFRNTDYLDASSNTSMPRDALGNRVQKIVYEGEFKWSGDLFYLRYSIVNREPGNKETDHSEEIIAFDGKRYYWAVLPPEGAIVVHVAKGMDCLPAGLAAVFTGIPPFSSLQYLLPYANLSIEQTNLEKLRDVFVSNLMRNLREVTLQSAGQFQVVICNEDQNTRKVTFDENISAFPTNIQVLNPTRPARVDIPFGELQVTNWSKISNEGLNLTIPSEVSWTYYNQEGKPLVGYGQHKSEMFGLKNRKSEAIDIAAFRPPLPPGSTLYDKDLDRWFSIGADGKEK